ncbi:unnamed protein product, partial [Symbiodinium sp. CCMP2456]
PFGAGAKVGPDELVQRQPEGEGSSVAAEVRAALRMANPGQQYPAKAATNAKIKDAETKGPRASTKSPEPVARAARSRGKENTEVSKAANESLELSKDSKGSAAPSDASRTSSASGFYVRGRRGLVTVDSRPTLQWSSSSINQKDARVPLYVDEFLQLDGQAYDLIFMDAEAGPRLMSYGLRAMQDYFLNDFVSSSKPFDDLVAVDEAWKLGETVMSCQDVMLQALDAIEQQASYDEDELPKRRAAAETAAQKILEAKANDNERKGAVQKWLQGEIDRLVCKSRDLKEKAGKAAEKAGCALYKLMGLVQKHGFADEFAQKLELWRQMDASQKVAYDVLTAAKHATVQETQADQLDDAELESTQVDASRPEDADIDASTQVDGTNGASVASVQAGAAEPSLVLDDVAMASQPDEALELPDEAETLLYDPYGGVNGDDQQDIGLASEEAHAAEGGGQNDSKEAHTVEGGGENDSKEAHTGEGGGQNDSKKAHTPEGGGQNDSEKAHTGEGGGQNDSEKAHAPEGGGQNDSEKAHTGDGGGQNDSEKAHTGEGGGLNDSEKAHTGEGGGLNLEKLAMDDNADVHSETGSIEILNDDSFLEAELARKSPLKLQCQQTPLILYMDDDEIQKLEAKKKAKRERMKFNRSLESANCPDVILQKAADGKYGTEVLKELFKVYKESGMNWMNSSIVLEAKRKQKNTVMGSRHYVSFEDLKKQHGQDRAIAVREEKKALQRINGDYQVDAPYWFKHPDWQNDEDMEMFLVYDTAKSNKTKTAKPKKTAKPNFQSKANAKIKDAKSLLTDAKMWAHKVDEERKKKEADSTVSPEMCDGYTHQINFLVANLTGKIDSLESVVVTGTQEEKLITPGMHEVEKAMDKYQSGQCGHSETAGKLKSMEISYVAAQKVAHEIQGLGVRPRQPLLDLASAGAYGSHESNIERDVMRRSMEETVPIHYVDVPVRARHPTTKEWCTETRKMPLILPHELCLYLYRRGAKHYGSDDCKAELKKFWRHFKKCTNEQVAASLNYASYGIAPKQWIGDPTMDPVAELNDIEPENRYQPTVLTEIRGDWKFYKDKCCMHSQPEFRPCTLRDGATGYAELACKGHNATGHKHTCTCTCL